MKTATLFLSLFIMLGACNNNPDSKSDKDNQKTEAKEKDIREEAITYNVADSVFNGYLTYDHNDTTLKPGVLVVHEWWGVNDYVRGRARQLAEMGYIALVVDMFGGGRTAANPQEAEMLATPTYMNPALTRQRIDAALAKLLTYKQADPRRIAAIGYCYGGFVVLNAAKLGSNLKAVVSFHGGLGGVTPVKDSLKANILVCHGGNDNFVPKQEVDAFMKGMDSIGGLYVFKVYPNATHAFTNPAATETGKKFSMPIIFNPTADSASWRDMKIFFKDALE